MVKKTNKKDFYKIKGAYHWDWYADANSRYHKHVEHVLELIGDTTDKRVLDIGAGDGLITRLIGAEGVDNNPIAVRLAAIKGVVVWYGDVEKGLPLIENSIYDIIFMGDVIEHLADVDMALKEIYRVLKIGGRLIISTPPKRVMGLRNSDHIREYDKEELRVLLETNEFIPRLFEQNTELDKIYSISIKDE
jgi:SAM-dependent methyltransferase